MVGTLADALNWVGISEDEFNAQLAELSTEAERNQLIMETLSTAYDEAAASFEKNNETVIKARENQAMLDESLAKVGESVQNIKNTLLSEFLPSLTTLADIVANVLTNHFDELITVVTASVAAFAALRTSLALTSLISALTASFAAFRKANEGATVAQWLLNAAMNANPFVLIATLVAGVVAALVTLWNTNDDFKEAVIGAWETIKETAVSVWEKIVEFFTVDIPAAFNTVLDFVENNWQSLLLFLVNPIAGALKMLYDLNPEFKEWVDNVWTDLKEGFGKIIDGAVNWGKDLLDNFIGGIKQKWNDLKGAVSDTAQTIKDFLGFSEPEKGPLSNFHTYAPDMMELFAKGIRDNEQMLKNQIAQSFDFGSVGTISPEFPGMGGGYVPATTDSFGGMSFDITLELDGAVLARKMYNYNQNETNRRGRSLLNPSF